MSQSIDNVDPTQELTPEAIRSRAKKGIAILTIRTLLIQAISLFSNALLTVFLLPIEYGIFFLVSAVINFLAYFSDIGFAASLIQKKKLENNDLKTIFTVQQVLVLGLITIVLLATPLISHFYKFDQKAIYLLWALSLSLLFSSLKTIPSVLLERKLEFNKLVVPQIIETVVFNATAVYLAWIGFGVASFTIGVLLRGVVGLVAIYIVSPWMPKLSFSLSSFKSILKFGIPYQANTFLAMIKDDGMILLLGGILGTQGVGLLAWAQKWAYAPLRFFMDQVIKVTFPAFARLQDNKKELSDLVNKSIFFICLLVFPSLVILLLTAPILVQVIPKYIKWSPALFALSLLIFNAGLAAVTTPLTNTLNAIGKISLTFKLMIMWTVLTWIFVPVLAYLLSLNGAAIGFTLVGGSSLIALYLTSRYIDIDYLQSLGKPLVASLVMGIGVSLVKNIFSVPLQQVTAMIAAGLIIYSLTIVSIEPKLVPFIKDQFRRKQ